jgi:hypothetical protein
MMLSDSEINFSSPINTAYLRTHFTASHSKLPRQSYPAIFGSRKTSR